MLPRYMKHNKHNLQVGQEVILGADYNNSSHVIIDSFTPNEIYATVHSVENNSFKPEDSWRVMTYRLTPFTGYNSQPPN